MLATCTRQNNKVHVLEIVPDNTTFTVCLWKNVKYYSLFKTKGQWPSSLPHFMTETNKCYMSSINKNMCKVLYIVRQIVGHNSQKLHLYPPMDVCVCNMKESPKRYALES